VTYSWGFDLEIAKTDTGDTLSPKDRLGIACAALVGSDDEVLLFYGRKLPTAGPYGPKLSMNGARALLSTLEGIAARGELIVGWNSLAFDLYVLGVEAEDITRAAKLAMSTSHVDLMVLFASVRRHRLGLSAAAQGCGTFKGGGGIENGALAPSLWFSGHVQDVLSYQIQDSVATVTVFKHLLNTGGFQWASKSGKLLDFKLPDVIKHDPIQWSVGSLYSRKWAPAEGWISTPSNPEDFTAWIPADLR